MTISVKESMSVSQKSLTLITALVLFGVIGCGACSIFQNGPNTHTSATKTAGEKGTLKLHAAIVYSYGGPQPVARQKIYLLDESVVSILKRTGHKGDSDHWILNDYIVTSGFGSQHAEKANFEIGLHTKYELMTDFEGKAQLSEVEPGQYFLFARVPTRGGSAIWNLPIEIKPGVNEIILDQNNSSYSR